MCEDSIRRKAVRKGRNRAAGSEYAVRENYKQVCATQLKGNNGQYLQENQFQAAEVHASGYPLYSPSRHVVLLFDLFHTEKAEVQDKTLQTTEFLNPELPDAQIKGGDGIGSKYENMAKSWGKIQDYSAVDNIERDEADNNQEEYESQYTEEDIALLDRQEKEKDLAAETADAKRREQEALAELEKHSPKRG